MFHELGAALGVLFMLIWLMMMVFIIAVLVLSILATMNAYHAGREGWWVYLILIFTVPLAGVILWYFFSRKNPIMMNGKPFL